MVWAGISIRHKTDLIFIDGNLNAAQYCGDILTPVTVPLVHRYRLTLTGLHKTTCRQCLSGLPEAE